MTIFPAIDLLGGKVVRLREGRRDLATVYSDRPGEIAAGFAAAGARRIHVVDLDGAFAGRRENLDAVAQIIAAGAPLQLGGGVRDLATCARLFEAGIDRVVLGTAMVKSRAMVAEACGRWPGRIVIAVDARGGKVAVEGWAEATELDPFDLAAEAAEAGCAAILFTDIARDGTSVGPNLESTARLARALHPVEVIASGGIASLADLRGLALAGVPSAVIGRALYEGTFTLAEAFVAAGAQ
ncbi:MAG: 1-(5-phosphoribosyl)-5-[(5-phosphoribosylamino)methylideneamino]imidazole-4-carboxamide isomerase [Myxococcales bacterium]|nr:1-(5-phosphoribosyl)-5-[(5-phosphoribosylamino)methylideneamino]imidazole-4-carboxamide isomerase [Myxococcales bacterium]